MRSVVVVLPASMWAMMPMFLQRSNGTVLGTTFYSFWAPKILVSKPEISPPVVREGFIGFRHAMHVFFFLDGRALTVGGIKQFIRQLINHALLTASAGVGDEPADRKRRAAVGIDLDRHLIVRATHATGLNFEQRLGVLDGLFEQLQAFVSALLLEVLHRRVENIFRSALLALPHHGVDELRYQI